MGSNIYITGFSGSGKTVVGREVARLLGWRFVDTDEEIVRVSGKPVDSIFKDESESRFRELERRCLGEICREERQVVSTGGGIVTDDGNRRLMEGSGIVICLEAQPDTVHRRLKAEMQEAQDPVVRPMLVGPDPLGRIAALKSQRQSGYALANWTVHTDHLTPPEVAGEVVRAWEMLTQRCSSGPSEDANDVAATVRTSSGAYPVWVGWGILGSLGERVRRVISPGAAYVITDEEVHRHARRAQVSLESVGIPSHMLVISPGERSKSLNTAQRLYGWLASRRAERGHLVLAVGGGVVGDLAGFVAATYMRGVLFGQVPTTLLSMVDAAIGGKTAVNLPQGKNLVGAFYQPSFVLADVQTLETLPRRELTSGWAEAIKYGLILDEGLLRTFEENREAIVSLDQKASTGVVRRSVAIKADVVSRDEKETLGLRVLLNYGHTIGHAIEAATGYGRFLHGEAVSVGMMGAAHIGNALGMLSGDEVERQRAVLEAFGLPVSCQGIDLAAAYEAMSVDKKTSGGSIRWVLLDGIGHAVTRSEVSQELVRHTLEGLCRQANGN